ncbi:MAG: Hsp20/alpha crystallin family protein [Spirochaetales bacterium]|uniref:Hsp20/alpha crystallin family protein n=1 Tax=Candidatus Thalassospirochaeta sargassi TaxID=3119039 RepID=A0AAJ1MP83_9SPIO|nr:Hsp20/alpha crystallin family protein [Spirochaetales bacterium]
MAITKLEKHNLYDPLEELKRLQSEINDLFDINSYPSNTGLFERNVSPGMDLIEKDHEFFLVCELPGLSQEDIDMSIASNVLTIKGTKNEEKESSEGTYFRKELWSGTFQRTLPLPRSIDPEKISAELKDGILRVTLPKKEEAKPKQIAVKVK